MANKPRIRSPNRRGPLPSRGNCEPIICQDTGPPQPPVTGCEVPQLCGCVHVSFIWSYLFFFFFFPMAWQGMLHLGQMFTSVCLLIPAKNEKQLFVCPSSRCSSKERLLKFGGWQELTSLRYSHPRRWQAGSAEVERPSLQLLWAVP